MLLHALQGFVIFLGWALTIAVRTQDGPTDGRTAYCFALVCLMFSRYPQRKTKSYKYLHKLLFLQRNQIANSL